MGDGAGTRWTLIRGAAAGGTLDREEFAVRYEPLIRAYLAARWRSSGLLQHLEDGVGEAFVTFFAPGGALEKVRAGRPGGFRAFLYGVVRNVARGFEKKYTRRREHPADHDGVLSLLEAREEEAARVFDRAWARTLLAEAARLQADRAQSQGLAAVRRVEILRLRFQEGLPIREIAARVDEPAPRVHREYARAREEFKDALRDLMRVDASESREHLDVECRRLLEDLA